MAARSKPTSEDNVDMLVLAEKGDDIDGMQIDSHVYVTFDLDQFRMYKENRPVPASRINKMVESIKEKNLLKHSPIIITTDGGIVDGQTRWLAAKQLAVELGNAVALYFTILDPNLNPYKTMRILNATSDSWGQGDYLHHYYECGVAPYVHIYRKREEKKAEGFSIPVGSLMRVYGVSLDSLKKGTPVTIDDLYDRDAAFDELQDIFKRYPKFVEIKQVNSIHAYMYLRKQENFSHKQLIHFIKKYPARFKELQGMMRSNKVSDRVETLQQMHNYRRQPEHRVTPFPEFD